MLGNNLLPCVACFIVGLGRHRGVAELILVYAKPGCCGKVMVVNQVRRRARKTDNKKGAKPALLARWCHILLKLLAWPVPKKKKRPCILPSK